MQNNESCKLLGKKHMMTLTYLSNIPQKSASFYSVVPMTLWKTAHPLCKALQEPQLCAYGITKGSALLPSA